MAVLIIEDLVSSKWITEIVSVEETSTQVETGFTAALEAEGLFTAIEARTSIGLADPTVDDEQCPILLAVSDNDPQMTSGSTREFRALCAIAQHFGRPGTDTNAIIQPRRSPAMLSDSTQISVANSETRQPIDFWGAAVRVHEIIEWCRTNST